MMSASCFSLLQQASFWLASFLLEERLHEMVERNRAHGDPLAAGEVLEVLLQIACALVPRLAILRERAHHDRLELRGIARADLGGARIVTVADELERLVLARALEEPLPGRQLEEHHAGGEDVAPPVHDVAPRLLSGDM